ncbi:MAG TPA: type II secretion system F family protein [Nitriliruptorales bacterium]
MNVVVVAGATGVATALGLRLVGRPPRRLAGRVRPWTAAARASLNTPIDTPVSSSIRVVVLRPLEETLRRIAGAVGADDDQLARRLDQAGVLSGLPPDVRASRHRLGVVGRATGGLVAGGIVASMLPLSSVGVLLVAMLGAIAGGSRSRAVIDRQIANRRERLRAELVTATQLLAMTVRIGGGVIQALQRFADRGHGLLAAEVRELLAQHTGGVPIDQALRHAAERTSEPYVARTHRLLATGATHGTDLAQALLDLGGEVRTARRESLRRDAVRRRATMLLPTIAILAPVMLLFVAAPLPSLVFGVR